MQFRQACVSYAPQCQLRTSDVRRETGTFRGSYEGIPLPILHVTVLTNVVLPNATGVTVTLTMHVASCRFQELSGHMVSLVCLQRHMWCWLPKQDLHSHLTCQERRHMRGDGQRWHPLARV